MIQQIWRIREKKQDGMISRPEARVLRDIILVWSGGALGYPNFLSHDPYKSRVSSMYNQIQSGM